MKTHGEKTALQMLSHEIESCSACPRLVEWRERVAREKRRAYQHDDYWGKPVGGFGDPNAALVIVGLAPGAHGANRTGRMFTGDGSGDFLYAALHRAGLASQPESRSRSDGLQLLSVYITAACRCAPPDNHPSPEELRSCRPYLQRELGLLTTARVYLALGKIAYDALVSVLRGKLGAVQPAHPLRIPPFSHGARIDIPSLSAKPGTATLMASFHVSRQNTQTGRLTQAMFGEILQKAAQQAQIQALV